MLEQLLKNASATFPMIKTDNSMLNNQIHNKNRERLEIVIQ